MKKISSFLFMIAAVVAIMLPLPSAARGVTTASVPLQWDPSPDASPDLVYRLYQRSTSSSFDVWYDVGASSMYIVTNLTPGVTYWFAVSARYATTGLESDLSNVLEVPIPGGAPVTGVSGIEFNRNSVRTLVRWVPSPEAQLVFQYEVLYGPVGESPVSLFTVNPSATLTTDKASTYSVSIRAIGAAGAGPWTTREVKGLVPPVSLYIGIDKRITYTWAP